MKMISRSDNSSSEEENSQELQRFKDAAVTLEPDGDLYTNKKDFANNSIKNENANAKHTEVSQNISSRPSLRPKETFSADPYELKLAAGFKIHVAKKLSDILDKELEFRSESVEKNSKNKSSDSGIRLLSSSNDFLHMDPHAAIPNSKVSKWNPIWKPKSYTKLTNSVEDKCVSATSRKRVNSNAQKTATSSSDSLNAKRQKYDDESMKVAIECIRSKYFTLGKAAKCFEIPKSTLQDKVMGKYAIRKEKTILTHKKEKKLAKWLTVASKRGCKCTKQQLLLQVQQILNSERRQTIFNNNLPGNRWYYAFLRRQGNLSLHQTQRLGSGHAALTEEMIRQWFKEAHKQLKEEGSDLSFMEDPHRIFNCDELGFPLCSKTGKVLTCKTEKQVNRSSEHLKTQITILTCASAAGSIMKPMLIFPGFKFHSDLLAGFKDAMFAKSPKGWLESDIFESWLLEVFIPFVSPLRKPVVLFLDGHITRVSLKMHELCIEHHILYYSLPHRASHIVQPLDLNLFKSFKLEWKKAMTEFHGSQSICKTNFSSVLKTVWCRTVTSQKIINGFRASGIYPWNPEAVNYQKICPIKLSLQLPPRSQSCQSSQTEISDQQKNLDMLLNVIQLISREKLMEYRNILSKAGDCREAKFAQFSFLYRKIAGIPEKTASFDNLPLPEECIKNESVIKEEGKEKKEKVNKKKKEKSNKMASSQKRLMTENPSSESEEEILDNEIVATVNNILNFDENNCCVCMEDSEKSGWIGCDKCERWFHKECVKTDKDLTLMNETEIESFPFICEYCS